MVIYYEYNWCLSLQSFMQCVMRKMAVVYWINIVKSTKVFGNIWDHMVIIHFFAGLRKKGDKKGRGLVSLYQTNLTLIS